MARLTVQRAFGAIVSLVAVPWGAFVAAFIFYVGLTLVAIGVQQLPDVPMAAAYLLPVAAYGLVVLSRVVRSVAAIDFHPGHAATPKTV